MWTVGQFKHWISRTAISINRLLDVSPGPKRGDFHFSLLLQSFHGGPRRGNPQRNKSDHKCIRAEARGPKRRLQLLHETSAGRGDRATPRSPDRRNSIPASILPRYLLDFLPVHYRLVGDNVDHPDSRDFRPPSPNNPVKRRKPTRRKRGSYQLLNR